MMKADDMSEHAALRRDIMTKLIEPTYYSDIKDLLSEKKKCRWAGCLAETLSKIIIGAGGVLSFASGVWSTPLLSFGAGSCAAVGLISLHLSTYFEHESKERVAQINIILEKLHLESMPDITAAGLKPSPD